ncbi:alkyl sulfatase C-terminal domain-containing protein [Altererythrobacter litoralis]|uniref:Alkyl sulfatase C-terminal domain-containing protein n=1 Tax=Altererythrobacter litoralis TaxID=3113904 RepID=A0ABU7GF52_9SPHN|nr:alkyl sulfatase C-terminal domain-containing protein [Erythrobacteraceae bacterium 1XM1-14]
MRNGRPYAPSAQSPDLIAAVPTSLLLDSAATRFDPAKFTRDHATLQVNLVDRGETAVIEANGNVMIGRVDDAASAPDVTISGPRQFMLGLLFLKLPLAQLQAAGLKVEGDAAALQAMLDALDPLPGSFDIVKP